MVKSTDKNAVSPHMAANPMQLLTLFKVACLVRCHLDMIAYFYARYRLQQREVEDFSRAAVDQGALAVRYGDF